MLSDTNKRLIDDGYGIDLADALAHESKIAIEWAKNVASGQIAQNRQQVQERGHEQDGKIN